MNVKKNMVFLVIYYVLVVVAILLLLGGIVLAVMGVVADEIKVNFVIEGIIMVVVAVILNKVTDHLRSTHCLKCGNSLMGANYGYDEEKRFSKGKKMVYRLKIQAECPYCGKINEFKHDFAVNPYDDPDDAIEEYCRKRFGEE